MKKFNVDPVTRDPGDAQQAGNRRRGFLAGLLLTLLSPAFTMAAESPTIQLSEGLISGLPSPHAPGISVFKGIPYARPPVAELRWRPPEPAVPWSGTRQSTEAGNPCWQPIVPETSLYSRGPISPSEDCLYLNIWSAEAPELEKPSAVMVWFHGGSNTTGHGSSLIFDGSRLATKGVVVVTANYRMGAFGFLAHPALSEESSHSSSGNYALLDQIAVLRWVQENIGAFGGDPDRVVIFGQSAGSMDVCLLMTSPMTAGLISGVIGHSGGCLRVTTPLAEAEAEAEKVAAQFPAGGLSDLRAIPSAELVAGANKAAVPLSRPIVDGWIIPDEPRRLFMQGSFNRVPLIVGDMADEFRGLDANSPPLSQTAYESQVREIYPDIAEELLVTYADTAKLSPLEARRKISTHSTFTWASRNWAGLVASSGEPSFVYHFTQPTAVFSLYIPERPEFPDPDGPRSLGAYHSGDLAYHFNNVGLVGIGWEDWDYQLADIISSYWVNFANTGNPNGAGLPPWPAYGQEADVVQEFGSEVKAVQHPRHAELDLFDQAFPAPE